MRPITKRQVQSMQTYTQLLESKGSMAAPTDTEKAFGKIEYLLWKTVMYEGEKELTPIQQGLCMTNP